MYHLDQDILEIRKFTHRLSFFSWSQRPIWPIRVVLPFSPNPITLKLNWYTKFFGDFFLIIKNEDRKSSNISEINHCCWKSPQKKFRRIKWITLNFPILFGHTNIIVLHNLRYSRTEKSQKEGGPYAKDGKFIIEKFQRIFIQSMGSHIASVRWLELGVKKGWIKLSSKRVRNENVLHKVLRYKRTLLS